MSKIKLVLVIWSSLFCFAESSALAASATAHLIPVDYSQNEVDYTKKCFDAFVTMLVRLSDIREQNRLPSQSDLMAAVSLEKGASDLGDRTYASYLACVATFTSLNSQVQFEEIKLPKRSGPQAETKCQEDQILIDKMDYALKFGISSGFEQPFFRHYCRAEGLIVRIGHNQ